MVSINQNYFCPHTINYCVYHCLKEINLRGRKFQTHRHSYTLHTVDVSNVRVRYHSSIVVQQTNESSALSNDGWRVGHLWLLVPLFLLKPQLAFDLSPALQRDRDTVGRGSTLYRVEGSFACCTSIVTKSGGTRRHPSSFSGSFNNARRLTYSMSVRLSRTRRHTMQHNRLYSSSMYLISITRLCFYFDLIPLLH